MKTAKVFLLEWFALYVKWICCHLCTGTYSDLQIHGPPKDTSNPAYYSVANPNFKDSELAEKPNSYYVEVNKHQEIKMTLNPVRN